MRGRNRPLAAQDFSGCRKRLETSREVRDVTDCGVIHSEIVTYRADNHLARIETHPHPHVRPAFRYRPFRGAGQSVTYRNRSERRPLRMVFTGEWSTEDRHETVAQELVDAAFESMHPIERDFEELRKQTVHRFRAKRTGESGRLYDVAKQDGDVLFFAA